MGGFDYIIWIRNGKVAGTSFEYAFKSMITFEPKKGKIIEVTTEKVGEAYGMDKFKKKFPDIWERAFKFMLVRHPIDRFVSAWMYFKNTRIKTIKEIMNTRYNAAIEWHLRRPQTKGLIVDGELDVDFLVRFESLQEDVDFLCVILGVDKVEMPHLRKSKRQCWQRYFYVDGSKGVEVRLRTIFKDDFKYLGYD